MNEYTTQDNHWTESILICTEMGSDLSIQFVRTITPHSPLLVPRGTEAGKFALHALNRNLITHF